MTMFVMIETPTVGLNRRWADPGNAASAKGR